MDKAQAERVYRFIYKAPVSLADHALIFWRNYSIKLETVNGGPPEDA